MPEGYLLNQQYTEYTLWKNMYCGWFVRGTKCYLGDKIKKNESVGDCGKYEGGQGRIQGLDGKTKRKRPFGKPKCGWNNKNEIGLQKLGCELAWIDLAQNRDKWRAVVKELMNCRCP
jgi:hypothetical protein